jgi:hypothetical protein
MKIYRYDTYDEYVEAQIEANVRKLKNVWVDKKTIQQIAERHSLANKILCHGTRNATEQKYFQDFYPAAEIIGTEISHTAAQFPMTVQWDFHNVNTDWINKFDIVYSNAIDHSYDPIKLLTTWKDQLTTIGKLYLEHGYSEIDNHSRSSDPLEIYDEEIRYLISSVGLKLIDIFETTGIKGRCPSRVYIISK